MNRTILRRLVTWAGIVALVGSTPLAAQLPVLPVYHSPNHGPGLAINADYARGFDDAADLNFFGGRAVLGLGVANVMAGAGVVTAPEPSDDETVFGGAVSLNLLQGPLVPVALSFQTGLGYLQAGEGLTAFKQIDVPIGVALALSVPSPGLSVEPWIAPRLHYRSLSPDIGDSESELGYGGSVGFNLTLPGGLGVHVAGEYLRIDDPFSGFTRTELGLGVGAHYQIGIPGIVPGGIIP